MSRGPHTFKQSDAERLVRVARKNGLAVQQLVVERGKISLITGPAAVNGEAQDASVVAKDRIAEMRAKKKPAN